MMTMESIRAEKARLAKAETALMHLQNINDIDAILSNGDFLISVTPVDGCYANQPIKLSLALTDAEQAVLGKSIQVVLEFARQRIARELEAQK